MIRDVLRAAIGTTDADEGLPHFHEADGKAGVFVERQAVLDAIDAVLAARQDEPSPALRDALDAARRFAHNDPDVDCVNCTDIEAIEALQEAIDRIRDRALAADPATREENR